MDLQLIGNSYGAAEYAGAYVSKAEPDTLKFRRVIGKAIQRCDPNLSYHSILKRVANATLSVREVGAPEAYYILLRSLPMHSKSRTTVKVKALRHNLRYYHVEPRNMREVAALAKEDSMAAIRIEPIERAYMSRPANEQFETMNFASFVEGFETIQSPCKKKQNLTDIWERQDKEGWIKRRSKPVVVQKSPWMKPGASNPSFCFSEIFLYVPWRTLDELPQSDEECVSKFLEEQQLHLDSELLEESNAKIARQEKLDLLKNSHDSSFLTSLPSSGYVFVTDPVNGALVSEPDTTVNPNSPSTSGEWKAKHNHTPEVIEKTSNF